MSSWPIGAKLTEDTAEKGLLRNAVARGESRGRRQFFTDLKACEGANTVCLLFANDQPHSNFNNTAVLLGEFYYELLQDLHQMTRNKARCVMGCTTIAGNYQW